MNSCAEDPVFRQAPFRVNLWAPSASGFEAAYSVLAWERGSLQLHFVFCVAEREAHEKNKNNNWG